MKSTSTPEGAAHTRDRIVAAAMELFGKQGFKATTIAQIEAAAGLSAGSGGLYRHFRTKRDLLEQGLRQQVAAGAGLVSFIEGAAAPAGQPLPHRLVAVARAGLRRLEQERDVNRLLLRDLADFPDLLAIFRHQELDHLFDVLVAWLRRESERPAAAPAHDGVTPSAPAVDVDVEAVAAVLISAISHYWVLTDVFGEHPMRIGEDRYLTAVATLAAAALDPGR
jgi:AcrR family transcriptional regulator